MLKKAGIVVAVTAAGLLVVSPMAFASDHESGASCHQDNSAKDESDGKHRQFGALNVQDSAVQIPIQACNNSVLEGVLGILSSDQENSDDHG
ncbi:MAG TPA: hypothetical protein VK735_26870 [Pseudonocardia sp.]|uniref:hypothetical protein n=1 Tax=Pseudonocardia sp. TaxID=60912 RepID=UPI002C9FD622|nr:hypothetical protein [Pseudonocardia sp.]HTF51083.1 hypothetical protein [Pseudonocardia sp.]